MHHTDDEISSSDFFSACGDFVSYILIISINALIYVYVIQNTLRERVAEKDEKKAKSIYIR